MNNRKSAKYADIGQLEFYQPQKTDFVNDIGWRSDESNRQEQYAKLIVRECLVDFYRRHLDTASDEDITVQVERYIQHYFGSELKSE